MPEPDKDQMPPRRIGVRALRDDLAGFLRMASRGDSFLVTARGAVLAEIRPPPKALRPARRPGALRGRIHMDPDFDTLPPDVLAAMEGEHG